ncbi:Superoxide dismutase [Cu-Zn] [Perkinsus olseni]|uniref:Superoxide dismutase [Cu-Zn] n=1 Tax=Perkinsus olseni TaxID=32597 RepID=A0A7J6KTU6_PEROL|nr:Superoxide dismutase [Cu-Zn] [Perkinsus olseni]
MSAMRLILLLIPLAAAELRSSPDENACNDLCKLIPGCSWKGSYCKSYHHPALCQDLHFVKAPHSSNATVCSVGVDPSTCPTDYPVRYLHSLSVDPNEEPSFPYYGYTDLSGRDETSFSGLTYYGYVDFEQEYYNKTVITYSLRHLEPNGIYRIYIHEKSSFTHGCKSTGDVYDPFYSGPKYGNPETKAVGDIGYVEADADGFAKGVLDNEYVMLEGPYSVLRRSVVLHNNSDGKDDGKYDYLACAWITPESR